MHIGNRSFPYPVLNRDISLSDYVSESIFKVEFDTGEDGAPFVQNGEVIFKNLHYTLTDESLSTLIENGKVKGTFIIESSSSVYRSKFDISSIPNDLRVSLRSISGKVIVSCYLYASDNINGFNSKGFIPAYNGYSFDIDKYDILAVDDGYSIRIDVDPSDDDKIASIFTVVQKMDNTTIMSYTDTGKGITITVPSIYFNEYENIKTKKECNNIAFSILAIPALSGCLSLILSKRYESIEDILDNHSWFNAVCKSYKRMTGVALTLDEFQNKDPFELSQLVLNSAPCNALKDFDNMLLGGLNPVEEESDDL